MNAPLSIDPAVRQVLWAIRDRQRLDEDDHPTVTGLLAALRGELAVALRRGRYRLTDAGQRAAGPRLVIVPSPAAPSPANDQAAPVRQEDRTADPQRPAGLTPRRRVDPARAQGARRGWEHRRERDEAVIVNLPPHLVPLWERQKGQYRQGAPDARAEKFMEDVECSGEREAIEAIEAEADRKVEALLAAPPEVAPERAIEVLDRELEAILTERATLLAALDPSPF